MMAKPTPTPHLETFTGQFELRNWKQARRIETPSGAIAWELSSALVSCQTAVLTLAASALDPGDRGKWRFDGRLLTLDMDDDSTYEYSVTMSGTSSMTTRNTTGGAQRLWTKER
jgi:hypothetical protein